MVKTAISNTRGYVLMKTLVFWYDLALLIIYMDVYDSFSAVLSQQLR